MMFDAVGTPVASSSSSLTEVWTEVDRQQKVLLVRMCWLLFAAGVVLIPVQYWADGDRASLSYYVTVPGLCVFASSRFLLNRGFTLLQVAWTMLITGNTCIFFAVITGGGAATLFNMVFLLGPPFAATFLRARGTLIATAIPIAMLLIEYAIYIAEIGEPCCEQSSIENVTLWIVLLIITIIGLAYNCTRYINSYTKIEQGLVEAYRAVDAASQAKSKFLASMSHEMRTPMNGVIGMTELILASDLADEQRQRAEIIKASSQAMMTLFDDLLSLHELETDRVQLAERDFVLETMCESVIRVAMGLRQSKPIEITLQIDDDARGSYRGDAAHISQILINLLANGIKFTDEGHIGLRVTNMPDGIMQFVVTDSGQGVPLGMEDVIFERYRQASGHANGGLEGFGLGLSICRELANLMHGDIALRQDGRRGATFVVTLPLPKIDCGEV